MKKFLCAIIGIACLVSTGWTDSKVGPYVAMVMVDDESASGAGLRYAWVSDLNVGIDLHATYLTSEDVYIVPIEAGVLGVCPLESASLYASAGACYVIPEDTGHSSPWGDVKGPDPALGFYLGAGVAFPMADNMEFFVEAQYLKAESKEETRGNYWRSGSTYVVTETTKQGMDIDGTGFGLGILWKF